jgi:hypothetical protein
MHDWGCELNVIKHRNGLQPFYDEADVTGESIYMNSAVFDLEIVNPAIVRQRRGCVS